MVLRRALLSLPPSPLEPPFARCCFSVNLHRESPLFPLCQTGATNWFLGHMAKTLRQLEHQLPSVDAVIEVRDARIPLTAVNHQFDSMVRRFHKPRLVVFTKSDLADPASRDAIQRHLLYDSVPSSRSAYTVATKAKGAARLVKKATEGVRMRFKSSAAMMLIVGMPNAGKSTLINSLRSQAVRTSHHQRKRGTVYKGSTGRPMRKRSRVAKLVISRV